MIFNRISIPAAAAVTLVILIDLATGQGPPMLNAYRPGMVGPMPPTHMGPMGYMPGHPRGEFDHDKKEYELGKEEFKDKDHHKMHHQHEMDKEYEKEYEKEKGKEKDKQSSSYLGSLSNGVSGAWKSITGRKKRDTKDSNDSAPVETSQPKGTDSATQANSKGPSGARSLDDYEFRQVNSPNYIYFKVPKNLVCYS